MRRESVCTALMPDRVLSTWYGSSWISGLTWRLGSTTTASPAGNRLERLKGTRSDQHSIRINDQYRVTFRWENGHAYEVEVEDYH